MHMPIPIHKTLLPQSTLQDKENPLSCVPYEKNKQIIICYPKYMGELAKEEADHHDEDDEDPYIVHQLESYRNTYYHDYIHSVLSQTKKQSHILEVGAGSGADAKRLIGKYYITLSDVSPETLNRTYTRLSKKYQHAMDTISFVACDGEHLPFQDNAFSAVYMVATFHHFAHPEKGIKEVYRVLQPGGAMLLGVEPNKTYFKPIHKLQNILFWLTHTNTDHISKADATMQGFSHKELMTLCSKELWQDIIIKPMWVTAGFAHYLSEFIFRAFRLQKRIHIPTCLEKLLVSIDEWIFKLPGGKHLGWHWIIVAKKKNV